ncbi:hypothetical protein K438DRAFT_1777396 [Mycena galopus ATCC 62051]|nr:hypothetical protein K438DRAFT_1777396 [Mycena galopus ATCC 62051]
MDDTGLEPVSMLKTKFKSKCRAKSKAATTEFFRLCLLLRLLRHQSSLARALDGYGQGQDEGRGLLLLRSRQLRTRREKRRRELGRRLDARLLRVRRRRQFRCGRDFPSWHAPQGEPAQSLEAPARGEAAAEAEEGGDGGWSAFNENGVQQQEFLASVDISRVSSEVTNTAISSVYHLPFTSSVLYAMSEACTSGNEVLSICPHNPILGKGTGGASTPAQSEVPNSENMAW